MLPGHMPFADIVGQQPVIERLRRAMHNKRLAHGYLFIGAEGTGREQTALALAQSLLCETPLDDGDACGNCASCQKFASGNHADLQVVLSEALQVQRGLIKAASGRNPSPEIRLDAVRELSRRLRMRAYEGRARVGIVVDAHRLRVEAANALLKTLEEPAPGTLLILIAPGPRALLDTLRSRCQLVRFAPLPEALIAAQLSEHHACSDAQAQALAERAEGSLRRAETLLQEGFTERLERTQDYLRALSEGEMVPALDQAAAIGRDRLVAIEHLGELQQLLRAQVLQAARAQNDMQVRQVGEAFGVVQQAERALRGNAMPQLTLEALAANLIPMLHGVKKHRAGRRK